MRKYIPLNFALMRHWENWVVLTLMVVLGGMCFRFLADQSAAADGN